MSQAKRRRERLSRVSEAFGEMLYENICLHWLPSSAPIACARSEANRARAAANGSGMIIRNSHENASWLGEPCSRRMNRRRNVRCTQRNPPDRRRSASRTGSNTPRSSASRECRAAYAPFALRKFWGSS